jgi:hypothetical protein
MICEKRTRLLETIWEIIQTNREDQANRVRHHPFEKPLPFYNIILCFDHYRRTTAEGEIDGPEERTD